MGAGLGRRFLARFIDGVIMAFLVTWVIWIVFGRMEGEADDAAAAVALVISMGVNMLLTGIISTAVVVGYFTLMESSLGWTFGKLITGLRTRGPDGENPSFAMALKRNIWHFTAFIPFFGILAYLGVVISIAVTISNSDTNTGWHDTFAGGTRVVRAS